MLLMGLSHQKYFNSNYVSKPEPLKPPDGVCPKGCNRSFGAWRENVEKNSLKIEENRSRDVTFIYVIHRMLHLIVTRL